MALIKNYTASFYALMIVWSVIFCSCQGTENQASDASRTSRAADSGLLIPSDSIQLKAELGQFFYLGKPFTGIAISKYADGKKASTTEYVDGKKQGFFRKWFGDGNLSFESYYVNGRRDGMSNTWWKNGHLRSESNYKDGMATGIQKQFYKSGVKFKFRNLEDGKEKGLQQSWRENGEIYSNYEAKNGRIFGLKRATLCYELDKEEIQYGNN